MKKQFAVILLATREQKQIYLQKDFSFSAKIESALWFPDFLQAQKQRNKIENEFEGLLKPGLIFAISVQTKESHGTK